MVTVKKIEEIRLLVEGGKILGTILREISAQAVTGVSTLHLNKIARDLIFSFGAEPAFENYRPAGVAAPYPCALCASLNNIVVHGVPSDTVILKSGDVLKLDLGIKYKNFFTDAAITLIVDSDENRDKEKISLLAVTKKSLELGLVQVGPGNRVGDIGAAIGGYINSQGLSVVEALVGHGVGYAVHEEPNIPNYGKAGSGLELKPGMVLAIEPMVTMGSGEVRQSADGFGYETVDGSLSAHFEHTVAVTEDGCQVLTK